MAAAVMRGANLLVGSSRGFSVLLEDTRTLLDYYVSQETQNTKRADEYQVHYNNIFTPLDLQPLWVLSPYDAPHVLIISPITS